MADAVTVVVPTRNRRAILEQTLRHVLGQRDVDVHVVVVDEGSTDDTPEVLAALAAADDRVRVIRHDPAEGLAAARNDGLAKVTTEWVAFCDDDDMWAPDKLAVQLAALAAVPGARWSCTGTVHIDPGYRIIGHQRPPASGDVAELLRTHNAIPGGGSTLLVATDLARQVGGYDAWFTGCEDYEMNVKLALRSPLVAVDRPLVAYRVWPGSMSSNVALMRTGHERVIERWRGDLPHPLRRAGRIVEETYLGRFHLRAGSRRAGAAHYLRMAVRCRQPRQVLTAVGALLSPALLDARHAAREEAAVPEAWRAEVAGWLDGADRQPVG